MGTPWKGTIVKLDDYRFLIPSTYKEGMKTDGLIFTSEELLSSIMEDMALEQVANVATLSGIVGYSMAMPDIHWGYGFPIGGVCATDAKEGMISPGGVGYDINCGVRLLRSSLTSSEVTPELPRIADSLFANVPSGVGSKGKIRVNEKEMNQILRKGSSWAVSKGFGEKRDVEFTEEEGCMAGADPDKVSQKAKERGAPQLGTLGSGNHFLEVQKVVELFDEQAAGAFGLFLDQVLVMIHCGSRGLGYQVCDDYLVVMKRAVEKYNISLPDQQLACAPISSPEGQDYLAAMAAAANFAWTNRQCIAHFVRQSFEKVFNKSWESLGMRQVYDVAHNIAKFEVHEINGIKKKLCVHRKGATRAFGPGNPHIPDAYREVGQPVLVPGDMGRNSYVLCGTRKAEEVSFGSACHGAGRLLSRKAAKKSITDWELVRALEKQGILIRAASKSVIAEEAPHAYKNVNLVVNVCHGAGISKKVAKLCPMAVVKG